MYSEEMWGFRPKMQQKNLFGGQAQPVVVDRVHSALEEPLTIIKKSP